MNFYSRPVNLQKKTEPFENRKPEKISACGKFFSDIWVHSTYNALRTKNIKNRIFHNYRLVIIDFSPDQLISQYLSECANHDRLLLIALEQLIHLLLFGDELCLEAIRVGMNSTFRPFLGF